VSRRLVIIGPGHPRLAAPAAAGKGGAKGRARDPATGAAQALFQAARAREDLQVLRIAALPPGLPGLRCPPGAVFTGLSGSADETLMFVPGYDPVTRLCRSWYVLEKLRGFLAAARPDFLVLVDGAPVPLDALALMRAAGGETRLACLFPPRRHGAGAAAEAAPEEPAETGETGETGEAAEIAALVLAELAGTAELFHLGAAPPARTRLCARACEPLTDAAECLARLAGPAPG